MTAGEDAQISSNIMLTAILLPVGFVMLSAFLTGNTDVSRDMAYVCYIITGLIVTVFVIGAWIDR